jgi:hypothetical protein
MKQALSKLKHRIHPKVSLNFVFRPNQKELLVVTDLQDSILVDTIALNNDLHTEAEQSGIRLLARHLCADVFTVRSASYESGRSLLAQIRSSQD